MRRILVVDDEEGILSFLKEEFLDLGYDVETAASGPEALAKVREGAPHLMLLDVRMPGMDGIETLKRVREIASDLPVVMMTAVRDEEFSALASGLGARDYLTKPVRLSELGAVVEKWCGRIPAGGI